MATPGKDSARYAEMRQQLEGRRRTPEAERPSSVSDPGQRLLYDLEVHQIELEMQNEELRRARAELEEAHARVTDLYEHAPVVYLTLDVHGRITEANLTAADMFGIERPRLIGRFLSSVVSAADRAVLLDHVERCVRERVRVECTIGLDGADHASSVAHVVSVPFLGPDRALYGCRTALTDITALKRAQQKLQFLGHASAVLASSFDYRATLSEVARFAVPTLADVCIVDLLDPGGQLHRLEVACAAGATAARLATLQKDPPRADETTALGRALRSKQPLLVPECTPAVLTEPAEGFAQDKVVKASGAQSIILVPMVARDQTFGAFTLLVTEPGRRYAGPALSTARDLATHAAMAIDAARLYERAQQAIRAREDLMSFVSHDLRNPLMGILLTAETMLRAVPGQERRRGWGQLQRIQRGAQQMRHLIDDLLDIASLDAGKLTFAIGVHPVKLLLDDATSTLAPLAAEKQLALDFEAAGEDLAVRCDRERAAQVLSNLVGNAIKFTPSGGSVSVSARPSGAQVLFTVTDTGPGISPELSTRIFERFWQAEESARKGRGLGLHIAKGLVERQGGSIWVEGAPAGGTTFSFTLPGAAAGEASGAQPPKEPRGARPRRSPDRP